MGEGVKHEKHEIIETEELSKAVGGKLMLARISVDSLHEDIRTCNFNDSHSIRELFYRTHKVIDEVLKCIGG